jgi:hypothetical protein
LDTSNRVGLIGRDTSDNFILLEDRQLEFLDHYVQNNIYYVLVRENDVYLLLVFMKGELLFESVIHYTLPQFGFGDLYFKNNPDNTQNDVIETKNINWIKIKHSFIGIYRNDKDRIQISGTIPNYFENQIFNQKNVYFDSNLIKIVSDKSKDWIGFKKSNQNSFYIKY